MNETAWVLVLAIVLIAVEAGIILWMRPRSQRLLREYDRKFGPPPKDWPSAEARKREADWSSPPFSEIQTLQDMATRQAAHDAAVAQEWWDKHYRRR